MSILYPIDKPVTADDVRDRANELLGRAGEWTPWQTTVLTSLRDNAFEVHDHYMRHVWYELEALGMPDEQAARDNVITAAIAMMDRITADDAADAIVLDDGTHEPHDAVAVLLMNAAAMVDDVMEGLRRGPCAIRDDHAHDVGMNDWHDIARFDDMDTSPLEAVTARAALAEGMRAVDALAQGGGDATATVNETNQRRNGHAAARNAERIARVVDLANQHYRLPDAYRLTVTDHQANGIELSWGDADKAADSHRPHGRDRIHVEIDSIGEIRPRAVADVARSGRLAALTLGRDAELRAHGHTLEQPPVWSWAGPLPLVRNVLSRLSAGQDIDVASDGMTVGPLLGAARIDLGDGTTIYSYNARTLDEWLIMSERIDQGLAHRCIGNPVSIIVRTDMLDDPAVTIARCDVSDAGTEFELASPLMRLQAPPSGTTMDPEAAWTAMLEEFDDEAVYGAKTNGLAGI